MAAEIPESQPARSAVPADVSEGRSVAYLGYITFVLALVAMLSAADQNVLSILLVPIKNDLKVSDGAMGALTGLAFSLVYATAALPLARIADTGNRRNIVAVAVAFWSLMTAACGLAGSYITLVFARAGVAIGESGHRPAIMSLIGDLYPRHRRGIAVAMFTMGSAVGIGVGAAIAGTMSDLYGWRSAFLVLGIPGIVVALLVMFTTPEPKRGLADGLDSQPYVKTSTLDGIRYLLSVRTLPRLLLAHVMLNFAFAAWLNWLPAFFMRVHHLSARDMSAGFGLTVTLGAIISAAIGGLTSDFLAKRGERWRPFYCTFALLGGIPSVLFTLFAPTPTLSMVGLFLYSTISGGVTSVSMTASIGVVRHSMRGLTTAAMGFCVLVLGAAGPWIMGMMNDLLHKTFGEAAVRYSLISVPVAMALAALLYFIAGLTTDKDAAEALRASD